MWEAQHYGGIAGSIDRVFIVYVQRTAWGANIRSDSQRARKHLAEEEIQTEANKYSSGGQLETPFTVWAVPISSDNEQRFGVAFITIPDRGTTLLEILKLYELPHLLYSRKANGQ